MTDALDEKVFKLVDGGKKIDLFQPTETKVDSTDIMNLSILKKTNLGVISFNITNLLDETYQRPEGYTQNGRLVNLGFRLGF